MKKIKKLLIKRYHLLKQLINSFQSVDHVLNKNFVWRAYKKQILFVIAFIILCIASVPVSLAISNSRRMPNSTNTVIETQQISPTVDDVQESISPSQNSVKQIISTPTPIKTPGPTSTTAPASTSTPTSTPTTQPRTPNPPVINISYPSESQSITMDQSQTFCVVDVPVSGDFSGQQMRHNINNQGWTSYTNPYELCYSPSEGQNTVEVQNKNSYGEESAVNIRHFSFHRITPTSTSTATSTPTTGSPN